MNIIEILRQLNIPSKVHGEHHHTTSGFVQIDCPFCSPRSNKFRLGLNLSSPYGACWSCGPKRLVDVLHEITGQPYPTCYELIKDVPWNRVARELPKAGRLKVPKGVEPMTHPHKQYLQSRGFDPEEIARVWGVQGIGLSSRLGWRLWIPVTLEGEVVSWTTRSIGDKNPTRYMSASEEEESVSHKDVLYGADLARHAIVICEGPIDAWAIGPGGVATLGLSYKRTQLVQMSRFPVRVICFDSETDAQRRARRLAADLEAFPGETYVVRLETGKDAADALPVEINQLREEFLV